MTEATNGVEAVRQAPRFRQYPEYKDSGIQWLGEIPAHWDAKRVKAVLDRNDGGVWGEDYDDEGTIVLRSTEQTMQGGWRIREPARRRLSPREASAARLYAGDLLVTKSSGSTHHIGKTSLADEHIAALNCCYSNFMQRLRLSAAHVAKWFWYFTNCPVARKQLAFLSSTTTGLGNLNGSILGAIRIPLPPPEEQRTIAAFLDRETATIDGLLTQKDRLIELLQEKRTALITRAVTRGLNPDAPMKDSGVEWLGQIPAHWSVKRLRHIVHHVEQGWSPQCENREAGPDEWGVLKAGCVNRGVFLASEHKALPSTLVPVAAFEINRGDLLMSRASGSRDLVGSVAIVPECRSQLLLCDKLFRLHIEADAEPRQFIAYAMNSRIVRWQIESVLSGGHGLASNISQEAVKDLVVAHPTRSEGEEIAAYVDGETTKIDALISRIREAMDHLQELRTALISAAVTGKIDVREARPR